MYSVYKSIVNVNKCFSFWQARLNRMEETINFIHQNVALNNGQAMQFDD